MNGYTGSREYESTGVVRPASGYAPCTCGGYLEWQDEESGTTYEHSPYVPPRAQHLAVLLDRTVEVHIY